MPKTVSLAVVDERGRPLGTLPPFQVEIPWWQESAAIVAGAREHYGVEVTVLRLLSTTPGTQPGGAVAYLAEAASLPPAYLGSIHVDLSDHPLRPPYARPGGPADSLRWAAAALADASHGPVTGASQRRTWNLSTIWRLDTPDSPVWLKQVPTFFQHEPAVLRWLADQDPAAVPALLADDDAGGGGARMLLEDVPGGDMYEATLDQRDEIAARLHPLQAASVSAVEALLAQGVPDRRTDRLLDSIARVARRFAPDDSELRQLVDDLPARMTAIASYGLPDALVHGDLHPGNAIAGPAHPVIIDWGDSFIGNPVFDILRLTERLTEADAGPLIDAWVARWRAEAPGSEPRLALELLRPVAALRLAVVYAEFLDGIEPSEHPYHAQDVPDALEAAKTAATTTVAATTVAATTVAATTVAATTAAATG